MHNSWNPENGMRHAVPLQAIREFLRRQKALNREESKLMR
jgi:hypothetical protein